MPIFKCVDACPRKKSVERKEQPVDSAFCYLMTHEAYIYLW